MPKAVELTKDNRQMLANRFMTEPEDIPELMPIGFFLVTDFGNDETFNVVSKAYLDRYYTKGEDLENGFFDLVAL